MYYAMKVVVSVTKDTINQTISAGIIQISEYWFVYVDLV